MFQCCCQILIIIQRHKISIYLRNVKLLLYYTYYIDLEISFIPFSIKRARVHSYRTKTAFKTFFSQWFTLTFNKVVQTSLLKARSVSSWRGLSPAERLDRGCPNISPQCSARRIRVGKSRWLWIHTESWDFIRTRPLLKHTPKPVSLEKLISLEYFVTSSK